MAVNIQPLIYSDLQTHAVNLVQDTDGVLAASDWSNLINEACLFLYENYGDRVQRQNATTLFNGLGFTGSTSFRRTISGITAIQQVCRETTQTATDSTTPLNWLELEEMLWLRRAKSSQNTDTAVPKFWTAFRNSTLIETSAENPTYAQNSFLVIVHPVNTLTTHYLSGLVDLPWVDLTTGQNNQEIDLDQGLAYNAARIAAVQAANLLRRPDPFINGLLKLIPFHIRARLGVLGRVLEPRPPVETVG